MRWGPLVALLLAGCFHASSLTCEDGTVCPQSTTCDLIHHQCTLPGQGEACDGLADGAPCTFGGRVGLCDQGVCLPTACGNGVLDPEEACDDGNTTSGDGCRADCKKVEVCGDGMLDSGEACDDGNTNAADGCDACVATTWVATALLGTNGTGTTSVLTFPVAVAVDVNGNVYIAETGADRVRKLDPLGGITTVAGGVRGDAGDGGRATSAELDAPSALAVDGSGNVYIADAGNHRVRRVDPSGIITTVAGTGVSGFSGDGGDATSAQISVPLGLVLDGLGNLYVADGASCVVRRVDPAGIITTVAGTGDEGFGGDGNDARFAQLDNPRGLALDGDGNLYIADSNNHRIRRVDVAGTITTVAGTGDPSFGGDGGAATSAQLSGPIGLAIDGDGNLLIADTENSRIRAVTPGGVISTIAGTAQAGFSGDGGPAALASLDRPFGVAAGTGGVYIADFTNARLRRIAPAGDIATVAGNGSPDGAAATTVQLDLSGTLATDTHGAVYLTDPAGSCVRRLDPSGELTTVAGNGIPGFTGDGGPATSAQFATPRGIAVDADDNLYIADTANERVRRVDAVTGVVTTIAGTGSVGYDPAEDGQLGTLAKLHDPNGIAVDGAGNVYIADTLNNRIRRVDPAGIITTVTGTGSRSTSGDGGPAIGASVDTPHDIVADAAGNLYFVGEHDVFANEFVRRIDGATQVITTYAGAGHGDTGDGSDASLASFDTPTGVALDPLGNLYVADQLNRRIRRIDVATHIITTVAGGTALDTCNLVPVACAGQIDCELATAGSCTSEISGDGGPALDARLAPIDVAVDSAGRVLVADLTRRLRRIDASGVITSVAGRIDPGGMGPLGQAHLADARAFVVGAPFTLFAGGSTGTVQALRSATMSLDLVAGRYPQDVATSNLARYRDVSFGSVEGIAYDAEASSIYIAETNRNRLQVITIADPADRDTWTIAPLGDANGAIADVQFRGPSGLYFDAVARQLYVADTGNHVIRVIDLSHGLASATVSTLAGVPATRGFFGDGGLATAALLFEPRAITRCANGDLFFADTGNQRVRRIAAATGLISTVLGDGSPASSGEGSPSSTFPVDTPLGLACDATGNLYVTSTTAVRLVIADLAGNVDGTGAVQTIYGGSHATTFPATVTKCLSGLAVIDAATVQVVDSCGGLLVELHRTSQPPPRVP